jgi:uncharacterized protein (TIGR02246 family)
VIKERFHGQVRQKSGEESQESDARAQARHPAQRPVRKEGDEPQTGDCDRALAGAPRGRKSTEAPEALPAEKLMTVDEIKIRDLVGTWMSATNAGDLDTVLGLMAEDVVFLVPGQAPIIGREAFAKAAHAQSANGAPTFDGRSEIKELTIVGDWAYMWSRLTVAVTPSNGGKPTVRAGHTLSIFRKVRGQWMLSRDANLLTAAPN